MKPDIFPEQEPKLYFISVEEFKRTPRALEPYQPGDKIIRENFNNFLMRSFAISMGQMKVQGFYLGWLKMKFGFDYITTLTNFMEAGGWDVLSDAEKNEFKGQFRKVGAHDTERWDEE